MSCDCEFTPDPEDPEDDWHYLRKCLACGAVWYGLHCPHDGIQNPCPRCDTVPSPVRLQACQQVMDQCILQDDGGYYRRMFDTVEAVRVGWTKLLTQYRLEFIDRQHASLEGPKVKAVSLESGLLLFTFGKFTFPRDCDIKSWRLLNDTGVAILPDDIRKDYFNARKEQSFDITLYLRSGAFATKRWGPEIRVNGDLLWILQ